MAAEQLEIARHSLLGQEASRVGVEARGAQQAADVQIVGHRLGVVGRQSGARRSTSHKNVRAHWVSVIERAERCTTCRACVKMSARCQELHRTPRASWSRTGRRRSSSSRWGSSAGSATSTWTSWTSCSATRSADGWASARPSRPHDYNDINPMQSLTSAHHHHHHQLLQAQQSTRHRHIHNYIVALKVICEHQLRASTWYSSTRPRASYTPFLKPVGKFNDDEQAVTVIRSHSLSSSLNSVLLFEYQCF